MNAITLDAESFAALDEAKVGDKLEVTAMVTMISVESIDVSSIGGRREVLPGRASVTLQIEDIRPRATTTAA